MAQQEGVTPTGTHTFDKNLQKNVSNFYEPRNSWSYARNAINNSATGDLGEIGNEPANYLCSKVPYTIIGTIHLFSDKWAIYSTNDVNSEIGIWDEDLCKYVTVVNDDCLNFKKTNLITGSSKENSDCTWQLYWQDALNPDRTLCIGDPKDWPTSAAPEWPCVSYIQICKDENGIVIPSSNPEYTPRGCVICEDTTALDCDAIRLASLVEPACIKIAKGQYGGEILNGSYYVVMAYTSDGERMTDYSTPSNVQPIFNHDNVACSLDIFIESIDQKHFTEFELVLVSNVNQQLSAKKVGIYSVFQNRITLDAIDNRWTAIPIDTVLVRNPVVDRCDLMTDNSTYLLRVGPYNKLDFNYQPLANLIRAKWQSVEYPANYYFKGGSNTGYMRDEVYAFWIRWVYDTGDKSASYHIPGRPARNFTTPLGSTLFETDDFLDPNCADNIEARVSNFQNFPKVFEVFNTASMTAQSPPSFNPPLQTLEDGGRVIAEGDMGYWESTELYPNNPTVWNSYNQNTQWDLCSEPIRHHKFPEDALSDNNTVYTQRYRNGGEFIRIMGVKFENIAFPVDNTGTPIDNIIGYEILRGTREGNRTVISKGMINRMGAYPIEGSGRTGLYPNFPYNDVGPDPFLTQEATFTNPGSGDVVSDSGSVQPITDFPDYVYTFHGPDTQFKNPFLSMEEMKIYGEVNCNGVEGQFQVPEKHPRNKLLTNLSLMVSMMIGVGGAVIAMSGKRRITRIGVSSLTPGASAAYDTAATATGLAFYNAGANFAQYLTGNSSELYLSTLQAASSTAGALPGVIGNTQNVDLEMPAYGESPYLLRFIQATPIFVSNTIETTDLFLRLIERFSPYQQYALTYRSHAFFADWQAPQRSTCNTRRYISDALYVDPHFQNFSTSFVINNLFRQRFVAFRISDTLTNTLLTDNSKITASMAETAGYISDFNIDNVVKKFVGTNAASHYVALKQRIRNQYGQIDGTMQMPTGMCIVPASPNTSPSVSPVIFGGDVYIGRYTEKNTMPFFYDWLYGQDDGYEYNYNLKKNVLYPRFWANTEKYDIFDFIQSVKNQIQSLSFNASGWDFPTSRFALDGPPSLLSFVKKEQYFYLFNSGVRDFFVESEINIDYRDWDEPTAKRHYDPYTSYTDLNALFNVEIIKSGNYYKYDYSLSISKLFNNYVSWGNMQTRDYDPEVSQKCYSYKPNTVIYSQPDSWDKFLPNNYKTYTSRPTGIKTINKSGIVIFFETESPIQYQGVDTLETADAGTKLTIGDGGLFSQPRQAINNVDAPYEYASCQSYRAPINTPAGLFWISANQGKIYSLGPQGAMELSSQDLKWWFATYLPFKLTVDFPDFELKDNPVIGIGCQSIYNNQDSLLYFCKKDYKLKPEYKSRITYIQNDIFLLDNLLEVKLGDKRYFDNASWTLSFDPKTRGWLSWHDWYPELLLGGKKTFMSTKTDVNNEGGIWVHNQISDLYCNFYGVDYPFEVEFRVHSGQAVQTLKSIEYVMEVYKYAENETDRYHFLDFNFDEAVIYNTEQVSGLLKLNLKPKDNPKEIVSYPKINLSSIDILYSKEENKYRFDQFWDITDDRGEFTNAQRMIWNTQPNGYIKTLNPLNLNYQKNLFQRKKFRHYMVAVLLRRNVSGNKKMLLMIQNTKNQTSPR